jgi:Carboxypeptidase regulatory-like domain
MSMCRQGSAMKSKTENGSFDLSSLPAGTYTLEAWHEKLDTSTQTITIGANQTKEISFVFKGM